MKLRNLITILSIVVLATACGKGATSDANNASSEDASGVEASVSGASSDVTDSVATSDETDAPGEDLSAEELKAFTDLFSTDEYGGFLDAPFNNPDKIDWTTVIRDGDFFDCRNVSKADEDIYLKTYNLKQLPDDYSLLIIRREALYDYIQKHTGVEYSSDEKPIRWIYIPENDSYYFRSKGGILQKDEYTCTSGKKSGDDYTLTFHKNNSIGNQYGKNSDRVIKLTKTDDSFLVRSNAIKWEDKCIESWTFDVELIPGEGNAKFITYPAEPGDSDRELSFAIVKDGFSEVEFSASVLRGIDFSSITKVTAIDAFDYNADGKKDFVIIGDTENGQHILMMESLNQHSGYHDCDAEANLEEQLAGNISMDKVKEVLVGDREEGKYENYKEAYLQLAKLAKLTSENFKYDLVYVDDDDIPELLMTDEYYGLSLYTFKDGYTHCLIAPCSYGSDMNPEYYYSPKNNLFLHYFDTMEGAYQIKIYMSPREGKEIANDYAIEGIMYEDTDGDGHPSEEEFNPNTQVELKATKYENLTDTPLSNSELNEKIAERASYEYEVLLGKMNCDELIEALK